MDKDIDLVKYTFDLKLRSQEMDKRNKIFQKLVQNLERDGFTKEDANKIARHAIRNDSESEAIGHGLHVKPVNIVNDACTTAPLDCNKDSIFRTFDGKCNNLDNPYWGATSTAYPREIPVDEYYPKSGMVYLDQVEKASNNGNQTRKTDKWKFCLDRGPLPSPRLVSQVFHTSKDISSSFVTHMLTQWGQFLSHDINLTPQTNPHGCCQGNSEDDDCFPIFISDKDIFYHTHFVNCLKFSRSSAYCEENGGPRQQMNAINSFIDASNVYGSDDETSAKLRSFKDGKLIVDANNLLPKDKFGFLLAGDIRASEMPGLASMHTLFVREHNRLCNLVKAVRLSWNDETIYQNVRRILIAEYQSIVYGGYLPTVLGSQNMEGLELSEFGSEYNSRLNPTMTNEFATAAGRYGHSMVQGLIKLFNTNNSGQFDEYSLSKNYFNDETYRSFMENILMGLISQPAQALDKELTKEITNMLFPDPGANYGSDLAARNIQRGRDHGLPGFCCYYNLYQDENHDCSNGWDKRYDGISTKNWNLLQIVYNHPNDIDLYTGALAQEPYNGGLGGKVFWTIFSECLCL